MASTILEDIPSFRTNVLSQRFIEAF